LPIGNGGGQLLGSAEGNDGLGHVRLHVKVEIGLAA